MAAIDFKWQIFICCIFMVSLCHANVSEVYGNFTDSFSLSDATNVYKLNTTSFVDVNFVHVGNPNRIYVDVNGIEIDRASDTFTFIRIVSADLNGLQYGSYKSFGVFESDNAVLKEEFVLIYEEEISNFQISSTSTIYNAYASVPLNFDSMSGSNIMYEWRWSPKVRCFPNNGSGLSISTLLPPLDSGSYIIDIFASNNFNKFYASHSIVTIYPVDSTNFTLVKDKKTIERNEQMNFRLKLDPQYPRELGILHLSVSFGDGDSTLFSLTNEISNLQDSNGFGIQHVYVNDGNYTAQFNLSNEISHHTWFKIVPVWEQINMNLLTQSLHFRVNEKIIFNVSDEPELGVMYCINFGDNSAEVCELDSNVVYTNYTSVSFQHAFVESNTYEVTYRAWNMFNTVIRKINLTIQHPIPLQGVILSPAIHQIPIPDGKMNVTLLMNQNYPTPTDVQCSVNYGDQVVENNIPVNLEFLTENYFHHTYTTGGNKIVTVMCSNLVSSTQKSVQVSVLYWTLSDIKVYHLPRVGMNMTYDPSTGNGTFQQKTVDFYIYLFKCKRLPPNVILIVDFNDSTIEKFTPGSYEFQFQHNFTTKNIYNISVEITNSTQKNGKKITQPISKIEVGLLTFEINSVVGYVDISVFEFEVWGLDFAGEYKFHFGDGKSALVSGLYAKQNHTYTRYGKYIPWVEGYNATFKEIAYYKTEMLVVDYSLQDLTIEFSNTTVDTPPGDIILTLSFLPNYPVRPSVTCMVNFDDFILQGIQQKTQNISYDEPMVFNFTYIALGYVYPTINCSNNAESQSWEKMILVWNKCFSFNGIFDRHYAYPNTPMLANTAHETELASRMYVYCFMDKVQYLWSIYQLDGNKEIPYDNFTLPKKPTGSLKFSKGSIYPATYRIWLQVQLDQTFFKEYTYVKFIRSAPYAAIYGGELRQVPRMADRISIDGISLSYDPEFGGGHTKRLQFDFFCFAFNISKSQDEINQQLNDFYEDLKGQEYFNSSLDKDHKDDCKELFVISSRGIYNLTVGNYDFNAYLVVMRLDLDLAQSAFALQKIVIINGSTPVSIIKCEINCRTKLSIKNKFSAKALCDDCIEFERPHIEYWWDLYILENGTYILIETLEEMSMSGLTFEDFSLAKDVLLEGRQYKLELTQKVPDRESPGRSSITFQTNYLPYDGSCDVNPKQGNSSNGLFVILCFGAKDEGERQERNSVEDSVEPLTYEYYMSTTFNVNGKISTMSAKLFEGSESTASVRLPPGDADFDYKVNIWVLVRDMFGDINNITGITAKVLPDLGLQNAKSVDEVAQFLSQFNTTYLEAKAGGDPMLPSQLAGSAFVEFIDMNSNDTEIKDFIKNTTASFMSILKETLENNTAYLEASKCSRLSGNVELITNDLSIVSLEDMTDAMSIILFLTKSLNDSLQQNPFPVEEWTDTDGTSYGTLKVAEGLFKMLIPEEMVSLSDTINITDVYEEMLLTTKYDFSNESQAELFEGEVNMEYQRRLELQRTILETKELAMKSVPEMLESLINVLSLQEKVHKLGEENVVMDSDRITMVDQKLTAIGFFNLSGINVTDSVHLEFDVGSSNETITKSTNIQTIVTDRPAQFYGKNAEELTSSGITVNVKDESGKKLDIPLTLQIKNKGDVQRVFFSSEMFDQDVETGMIYLKFLVRNIEDSLLVYVLPTNFSSTNYQSIQLYNVYLKHGSRPTPDSFDFTYSLNIRDLESSEAGFKVFVHSNILEIGTSYIALKPQTTATLAKPTILRRRRSVDNNQTNNIFDSLENSISIAIAMTGCRTWNEADNEWVSEGCEALELSTLNETVCRCPSPPGNTIATTFFVPPNKIDFNTVFNKIDLSNAAVYGTLIGIFVMFSLIAVYCHKKDKADVDKWATYFLCDSDEYDNYFYLITVETGLRRGAGTSSMVNFVLSGVDGDTGIRILNDGVRHGFPTGSVQKYFMGVNESLGNLHYLHVWHDSSGKGIEQSWFLNNITIEDLQTNEKYLFICNKWLALEYGDGEVSRILPVCDGENLDNFGIRMAMNTNYNITEDHLWVSMFLRPQESAFTRVERVYCILALLFLTMIANAMFFKDSAEETELIRIGTLKFSPSTIYVSIIGILITTPPILLVTFLFKKSRGRVSKNIKQKKELKKEETNFRTGAGAALMNKNLAKYTNFFEMNHLPLPFGCRCVAWSILFLSIAASSFFLFLYSMEWGKSKSEQWLLSFVLSFFESIIFVDPLKVIIISILISIILKKATSTSTPAPNLDEIRDASKYFHAGSTRVFLAFRRDVLGNGTQTQTQEEIETIRRRRRHELKAQEVLLELISYGFFCFILYSICYVNVDQRTYALKEHMHNELYVATKTQFGFEKVVDYQTFMIWMNETLFPKCFPQTDYTGKSLGVLDKQFFIDMDNVKIGPPRLRLVKMARGDCDYKQLTGSRTCVPPYNMYNDQEGIFCNGWAPYDGICDTLGNYYTQTAWKYVKSEDIWGTPLAGDISIYGGGGYLLLLDHDLQTSRNVLKELMAYHWINRETRAVFVEFTLYNANVNLFTYLVFLAEFPEVGGMFPWWNIQSFRAYQHVGATGSFAILCYIAYLIYVIVNMIKMIRKIYKEGRKFFFKLWNLVDILCIIMSCIGVAFWVLRYKYAQESVQLYYDDKDAFINFQHIVNWDTFFNIIQSLLIFVATVRILKMIGYNDRMNQLTLVVSGAGKDLLGFGVIFGLVYLAYISLGFLLFGPTIKEYRSIYATFGSLSNTIIGRNSLDSMVKAVPAFAQFYFFTYVIIVIMTLMTISAAILNNSISNVKNRLNKQPEIYGIFDYIKSSISNLLGIPYSGNKQKNQMKYAALKDYLENGQEAPKIDASNIVKVIRETFGNDWANLVSSSSDDRNIKSETYNPGFLKRKLSQDLLFTTLDEQKRNETVKELQAKLRHAQCNKQREKVLTFL